MWQKAGEKKNWFMRTACVLLIMVLFSIQWICGVYARFAVEETGSDEARTAAFAFETKAKESSQDLDLSAIKKPGDQQVYTFTVSNQQNGKVSEVAEKYRFTVQMNGSMPLKCTLSGKDGTILEGNMLDATTLPLVINADGGQFDASEGRTDTYTLTVNWPQEASNVKYASGSAVAEVVLKITAEQID